jgi:hypothetical protein
MLEVCSTRAFYVARPSLFWHVVGLKLCFGCPVRLFADSHPKKCYPDEEEWDVAVRFFVDKDQITSILDQGSYVQ